MNILDGKFDTKERKMIEEDPCKLQFIENQTEELCLYAVKKNGFALEYVRDINLEICIEAIQEVMGEDFNEVDEDSLKRKIEKCLKGKKYEFMKIFVAFGRIFLFSGKRASNPTVWSHRITHKTLARIITNEFCQKALKEMDIRIRKETRLQIVDMLKDHSKCLIRGNVVLSKNENEDLSLKCLHCKDIIYDTKY